MKRFLGLDLGTNSIGWAVVVRREDSDSEDVVDHIEGAGSRIIPMDAAILGDFEKGNSVSQTAERTSYRGIRRLRERFLLRRERLNRVLDVMGFLPSHYSDAITRYGKFKQPDGCKLAWRKTDDGKSEFVFMDAYKEMLAEFKAAQHEWLDGGALVPYDWTIYYLRKKALSKAISKQELAWILLNFNHKRGYYQLRGEDEADDSKSEEILTLKIVAVNDTGERKGNDTWYEIMLENGMTYRRALRSAPDWVGTVRDFVVTTALDKSGKPKTDSDGNIKRSLRMPKEDDWTLVKKKTEASIRNSGKEVGEYIYDSLLANPAQKIKGKLARTIERFFSKQELKKILETQKRFIPELSDASLYESCISELYPSNDAYRKSIERHDFTYLFVDDIIFYQRPLKSKKTLVSRCPFESHVYVDKTTGEIKTAPIGCVAKSNPLYQEFRLWQFVANLRIYRQCGDDGTPCADTDVTDRFLAGVDERVALFDWLNDRREIDQKTLFKTYFKVKPPRGKDVKSMFRWNYVEDKSYPCNETRGLMIELLGKTSVDESLLTPEVEKSLWHILYSVSDKSELESALRTFAVKHDIEADDFVAAFVSAKPFEKDYGSYSEKAIKRLLPLMRMGHHWNEADIDDATLANIDKIISGRLEPEIAARLGATVTGLTSVSQFSGLPLWQACYVVYGRHSEARNAAKWTSPADIDAYLADFKQHSLRNPVVEQVVTETLRTVRDIWRNYGDIDEIHIEMGRSIKQTAGQRKETMQRITDNESANIRAKVMLAEFMNPEYGIAGVRSGSPSQQELFRIYEEGVLGSVENTEQDILGIIRKLGTADPTNRPTHKEFMRYKLWLDQKYCSPYTGRPIPLARLFTADYQIEHIIPQSRYFDDSFSNKVICEAAVNSLKDRMLGMEFIRHEHGRMVELGNGASARILEVAEYERLVTSTYKNNRLKMTKLLMEDIPDGFIQRQINDTRYISKFVRSLMSNIVREDGEAEETSKNVIISNGTITDRLKREWGIADVWNSMMLPRFKRLDDMTGTRRFTRISANGHETPDMPLELQKGFSKKRIDHRHHAMDALVIACTTREHVNLLSNEAAMTSNGDNRYRLSRKLRRYERVTVTRNGESKTIPVAREFLQPWPTFVSDVRRALSAIIVSFKQNLRIINKTVNHYQRFADGKKTVAVQVKGDSWAVRKPLHKETVFGEVNLRVVREVSLKEALKRPKSIVEKDVKRKIISLLDSGYDEKRIRQYFTSDKEVWGDLNLSKIKVYYFTKEILDKNGNVKDRYFATRKSVDTSFNRKRIEDTVTDTGIQKILLRHLEACGDDPVEAFSPEGIEEMNSNIVRLNNGKYHKPIYKVRVYEKADKYPVGKCGGKSSKFVEAAKGTNLFFAVYETEVTDKATGDVSVKRSYATIPLYDAVKREKAGQPVAPLDENGNEPAFVLSPNDLVYLPTKEEIDSKAIKLPLDNGRIYKMVSSNGYQCFFIKSEVASSIVDKFEFSSLNKMERAVTGEMIKEICVPVKVDRIGRIIEINGKKL